MFTAFPFEDFSLVFFYFWIDFLKLSQFFSDFCIFFRRCILLFSAVRTNFTNQSLTNNKLKCWGEQIGFNPHIHEPRKWIQNRIGMECCKDQMSGQGSIDRNLCGFFRSGFSYENNIRILPENRFEACFIIIAFIIIDLWLLKSCNFIFYWVFKSDDFFCSVVEFFEDCIKCGCFTRSCWSGNNDNSVRFLKLMF